MTLSEPMPWLWSCHKCHTRYPLGATRRCLHDGHYFCGGTTTNTISGKIRRHKACRSEFDYHAWHSVGLKKGNGSPAQSCQRADHKDCQKQCDFPSACHWKAKQGRHPAPRTTFDFLDPSCLGNEPAASTDIEHPPTRLQNGSSQYANKILKAAENTTAQAVALLSKIQGEKSELSESVPVIGHVPLLEFPSFNGLGLSFPVMDLVSFRQSLDDHNGHTRIMEHQATVASTEPSAIATRTDTGYEDTDIDMTDWISDSPSSSPELSPTRRVAPMDLPFDFHLEADRSSPSSYTDEGSLSPTKTAWDWTTGCIGIALTTPPESLDEERWKAKVDGTWEDIALPARCQEREELQTR